MRPLAFFLPSTLLRVAFGALVLSTSLARAVAPGEGRITFSPGWKMEPQDTFVTYAKTSGHTLLGNSPGGPAGFLSFAYACTEAIDVEISAFAAAEQFRLLNLPTLNAITYGAIIGARGSLSFFEDKVRPSLFIGTGIGLGLTSGGGQSALNEKLNSAWVVGIGLAIALDANWDFNLDYRLMIGVRDEVTGVGSLNGGGSWFTIGFSYLFAPDVSHAPRSSVPNMEDVGGMHTPDLPMGHDL